MPRSAQPILVAYVPVLHRGYLQFFEAFPQASQLFVLGDDLIGVLDYLRKDLRALRPRQAVKVLRGLGRFRSVSVMDAAQIRLLDTDGRHIVMPNDEISHLVCDRFLSSAAVMFYPVFLMWDRRNVRGVNLQPDGSIRQSRRTIDRSRMDRAVLAARRSTDIWRHVGAVLVGADGSDICSSENAGIPTAYSPWIDGDARMLSRRGSNIEVSNVIHAEARVIAQAARRGVALRGASIYVTDFPCPQCAKLVAESGITSCYFSTGYAVLDGRSVLEAYGVELVRVSGRTVTPSDTAAVLYPDGSSSTQVA